jgi:hypothetical protein
MRHKIHLFIAGTPRSGTTAITRMLSHHTNIALCMERFKYVYKDDVLVPADFSLERILEFRPSETNFNPNSPEHSTHYKRVLSKWADSSVIGDKCPTLYKKYLYLSRSFAGTARFLYLARDIEAICSSWNARALNNSDPWPRGNDFTQAVSYWNDANRRTVAALDAGLPILVVSYDGLFDGRSHLGDLTLKAILDHVSQTSDPQLTDAWRRYCVEYEALAATRPMVALPGQDEVLARRADHAMYKRLMRFALSRTSIGRVGGLARPSRH